MLLFGCFLLAIGQKQLPAQAHRPIAIPIRLIDDSTTQPAPKEHTVQLDYYYGADDDGAAFIEFYDFDVLGPDSNATSRVEIRVEPMDSIFEGSAFINEYMPTFRLRLLKVPAVRGPSPNVEVQLYDRGKGIGNYTTALPWRVAPPAVATPEKSMVPPPAAIAEVQDSLPPPTPCERAYERLSPEAFIQKCPRERALVAKALDRLPLQVAVEETSSNVFQLDVKWVRSLTVDSVAGGVQFDIYGNEPQSPHGHRLTIAVFDTNTYRVYLRDSTKSAPTVVVPLEDVLAGTFTQRGDSVAFTFRDGHPPYRLLFLRDGVPIATRDFPADSNWTVALSELYQIVGTPGTYSFELSDQRRAVFWNFTKRTLRIDRPVGTYSPYRILLAAAGVLLVLCLLIGLAALRRYWRRRAGRRRMVEPDEPASATQLSVATKPQKLGSRLRITRRHQRSSHGKVFNPSLIPEQFIELDLSEHWGDTAVVNLFFGYGAVRDLDRFLNRENLSKLTADGEGGWENQMVPEIGGMLLGQYESRDASTYCVSIEQFVPLQARAQNLVRVEIDPLSLARDLGRAQDEYPDLGVVGWFHTHPGHGLFLSPPDLRIHYGHFRLPYHLAMEIDSLSPTLETGFFTYRSDGSMNNIQARRPATNWFSWRQIARLAYEHSPKSS